MSEGVSEKQQQSTERNESWSLGQENLATTDPLLGRNIPKASTLTSPPPSTVLWGLPLPDPAEARGKAHLEALWDVNCFLSLQGCGALCCMSRPTPQPHFYQLPKHLWGIVLCWKSLLYLLSLKHALLVQIPKGLWKHTSGGYILAACV